jgi:DNA-directed RNA polymerase beta' subunit
MTLGSTHDMERAAGMVKPGGSAHGARLATRMGHQNGRKRQRKQEKQVRYSSKYVYPANPAI